jgi:hypothetical protein
MRMPRSGWVVLSAVLAACSGSAKDAADAGDEHALRLNEIQLKATHNSYHVETPGTTVPDWKYSEKPLDEQLEREGVRGFELDTHFDTATSVLSVHHVPGLDAGTTCKLLSDCLTLLKTWSDAHPKHHTLFLHIEPKDAEVGETPDYAKYADALDAALIAVWSRERLVTPADVQGSAATLRDGIEAHGWPTVESTRGKLLVYLDNRAEFHQAYTRGGADLHGRVAFPSSQPAEPIAGVIISNTPTDAATLAAVKAGFIVRTRPDGVPVPTDIAAQREAALASGAQIVSTDFPVAVGDVTAFDLPSGMPSRCNPVTAPAGCSAQDVEDPGAL